MMIFQRRSLLLVLLLCVCATTGVVAQTYMNEWIDHNKTYYRFRVGATGLYRITQTQLSSLGLGNVNATHFQLWRNGEEVALYTSVSAGQLGAEDYLEFYGEANNGIWEKKLYLKPEFQINEDVSLFSDSSTYFLTVDASRPNKRFQTISNDLSSSLTADSFFMHNLKVSYRNIYHAGFGAVLGETIYSASYDEGEGYTSSAFGPSNPLVSNNPNLFVATNGPNASMVYSAAGRSLNTRNVRVELNGTSLGEKEVNYLGATIDPSYSDIPLDLLSSGAANFRFINTAAVSSDRMVIGSFQLTYPRQFNFGGQSLFYFELPANPNGNKLLISNFNHAGVVPVLYDLTNNIRVEADLSIPGQLQLVLPPSLQSRKLVLSGQQTGVVNTVNGFFVRNFNDYRNTGFQGNYLLISNPLIYTDKNGVNQVERYRQYRSSSDGGAYNAKIYDIEEIIDQFGYGIKRNPVAVKNFFRFAREKFAVKPKYSLLIGKGVNPRDYKANERLPISNQLNLVPTFGVPSSDVLLTTDEGGFIPKIAIGRINAVNASEVGDYLNKVIEYEKEQQVVSCKIEDEIWKKDLLHIGGANDFLGEQIMYYLGQYQRVAEDSLFGARVNTLQKSSLSNVQIVSGELVSRLFKQGFPLLTYFGHSSANSLEFNLDNPENYPFSGRYPIFLVNGCNAGNLFTFDSLRLKGKYTLSEKYLVSTPSRGSVVFLASTHLGIVNYLHLYSEEFYNQFSKDAYGQSIGQICNNIVDTLMTRYSSNDFFMRLHIEEITLHGDPAIHFYSREKPDYAIETQFVKVDPEFVSIAERNFNVKVSAYNIGRFSKDSVNIKIQRQFPDGTIINLLDTIKRSFGYADSLELSVPINPLTDKGVNKIIVSIDSKNLIDEVCETNNTVTKEIFIYEDELRPIYPYPYSIVRTPALKFYASSANPLSKSRRYYIEIDTTLKFNSVELLRDSVTSLGGTITFTPPSLSLKNGLVYYWRVGVKTENADNISWNNSSFIYRPDLTPGFNQSHYYQFTQNNYNNLVIDSASRKFEFKQAFRKLKIRTGLFPFYSSTLNDVFIDLEQIDLWRCGFNAFQVYVFEPRTLNSWKNSPPGGNPGLYGSLSPCGTFNRSFFEYYMEVQADRNSLRLFLEQIPKDHYVLIINQGVGAPTFVGPNTAFIEHWMADTAVYGSGNSIYHSFIKNGLTDINKFTKNLPFAFLYQKGNPDFIRQFIGENTSDFIDVNIEMPAQFTSGYVETPWMGPAKKWSNFQWDGFYSGGQSSRDSTVFYIYGREDNGFENLLAVVRDAKDTSIAFLNAAQFPYLKMRMFSQDPVSLTPFQLQYWRLTGEMLPEGAIAPNVRFDFKDTLDLGEPLSINIAFKNISETAFDSLKLKMILTDRNNVPREISFPRKKALIAGDTLIISAVIDTKDLAGLNSIFLFVNPDNDQPEQYLFNNFIYKSFFVKPDVYQPWLDVTFDGVHILNRDIVSSKPHILAKLKDESRFMALNDTAGVKVQIRYPDRSVRNYVLGSDSARFTPANLNAGENAATIDIYPDLKDGEYELIVNANDRSGNKTSELGYRVSFQVINKPMISNLLNYPNPFTTSTAFVFTLTGSEVPQNMRIQILTITGKVVREITKNELGPIRIGRNITEYKWDGTDQYGNRLGNGIYLYRVITNHNGKSLDKFSEQDVFTNEFFTRGYGKMYLMR